MSTYDVRILVIKDTDTKKEVYGQIIHDEFINVGDPVPSTDAVVRAYMAEFCSQCYIRNNKLDNQTLSNDFSGVVATVAEEAGRNEYNVVVRKLSRPVDELEIIEYHNKTFTEWNAALELSRGNSDPRPLHVPEMNSVQSDLFWLTVKQTIAYVTLAMLVTFLYNAFTNSEKD